MNFRVLV